MIESSTVEPKEKNYNGVVVAQPNEPKPQVTQEAYDAYKQAQVEAFKAEAEKLAAHFSCELDAVMAEISPGVYKAVPTVKYKG